jgi:hypothetical protein
MNDLGEWDRLLRDDSNGIVTGQILLGWQFPSGVRGWQVWEYARFDGSALDITNVGSGAIYTGYRGEGQIDIVSVGAYAIPEPSSFALASVALSFALSARRLKRTAVSPRPLR